MNVWLQLEPHVTPQDLTLLLSTSAEFAVDDAGDRWVRATATTDNAASLLSQIPGTRYRCDGQWLIQWGSSVATQRVPNSLNWQPLSKVFSVQFPPAAMAGSSSTLPKQTLTLRRGGQPQQPAAAIVDVALLKAWCDRTSNLRLRRLRWALRESEGFADEGLVMGWPLPNLLPAKFLCAQKRVLIPSGFEWFPKLDADDVLDLFQVPEHCWLVWERPQQWSIVADDALVALRRSSIRKVCSEQSVQTE